MCVRRRRRRRRSLDVIDPATEEKVDMRAAETNPVWPSERVNEKTIREGGKKGKVGSAGK